MARYRVTLTAEERRDLEEMRRKGIHKSQKVLNGLILLNCDEGTHQKARQDNATVAHVLQISERKINRVKQRFVEDGLEVALNGRSRQRAYEKKADGDFEAHIVALSCGDPPEGLHHNEQIRFQGINHHAQNQSILCSIPDRHIGFHYFSLLNSNPGGTE